jgi:hypothetical protein
MYFTFEKKHQIDPEKWITEANSHVDFNAAMHRYHAVMDAHAYGNNVTLDYVGLSVETQDGRVLAREIDDRIPPIENVVEPEPEAEG